MRDSLLSINLQKCRGSSLNYPFESLFKLTNIKRAYKIADSFYLAGTEGFDLLSAGPSQLLFKASLQELTPLQIATGNFHPECLTRKLELISSQTKSPSFDGLIVWLGRRDSTFLRNSAPMVAEQGRLSATGAPSSNHLL